MTVDTWNPQQYEKFKHERERPFFDLMAMVRPSPAMRVVDLGCGTGKQTRMLHEQLGAQETTGIDRSAKMLEPIRRTALPEGLRFEVGSIEDFPGARDPFDLVFSNAALHWVDNHAALIPRLAGALKAGGQLAFQVPAMQDSISHLTAAEIADEQPFRSALGGRHQPPFVLTPVEYARAMYASGFGDPETRLMVYPHVLAGREAVVEWMKGTLLTEYQRHLPADLFESFVERYRSVLVDRLEPARPLFFPYKRILCWGQRA